MVQTIAVPFKKKYNRERSNSFPVFTSTSRAPKSLSQSSAVQCRYISVLWLPSCVGAAFERAQYQSHWLCRSLSHTTCGSCECLCPHSQDNRKLSSTAAIFSSFSFSHPSFSFSHLLCSSASHLTRDYYIELISVRRLIFKIHTHQKLIPLVFQTPHIESGL